MSEAVEFKAVPGSYEDLNKINPQKFYRVIWVEDQKPLKQPATLVIDGQLREVFSTGLQMILEDGRVARHQEQPGVDEWIVDLWNLDEKGIGGQYQVEGQSDPYQLKKRLNINDLVGSFFELSVDKDQQPQLVITSHDNHSLNPVFLSLKAHRLPAGKSHHAKAHANSLYFVFKTRPLPISTGTPCDPV